MNSARNDTVLPISGFPIRKSPDQSLLSSSPKLFAASHVLHRLLAPRHPPYALRSLTTYAVATKCAFNEPVTRMQLSKNLRIGPTTAGWIHDIQRLVEHRATNTQSGADRNRTDDLRLARAALSHLSYSPPTAFTMVGLGRVELPTLPLSGVRSSQLSYRPGRRAGPSKLDGDAAMLVGCTD